MSEIDAFSFANADHLFTQLVAATSAEQSITITCNGLAVSQITAAQSADLRAVRIAAVGKMRELASRNTLGGLNASDLRDEGRR